MKKIIIISILIIALTLALGACGDKFEGDIISNEEEFTLTYTLFTGTEIHTLELLADDKIEVNIESISGRIDVEVIDGQGNEIYRGNDASSSEFTLEIETAGTYTFTVKGKRAEGSVSFVKTNG